MTRFEQCLEFVLRHEGGYSNHPADKGGSTFGGITQATYDDWRIGQGFGRQPVVGISSAEVKAIYKARYWILGKCDKLPAPLDYVHFDSCVNHGTGQAAKFLQRALGVTDDGAIGPKTLAAVREDDAACRIEQVCTNILDQRESFYLKLAEKDPKQKAFIRGWLNRITDVRAKVLE